MRPLHRLQRICLTANLHRVYGPCFSTLPKELFPYPQIYDLPTKGCAYPLTMGRSAEQRCSNTRQLQCITQQGISSCCLSPWLEGPEKIVQSILLPRNNWIANCSRHLSIVCDRVEIPSLTIPCRGII